MSYATTMNFLHTGESTSCGPTARPVAGGLYRKPRRKKKRGKKKQSVAGSMLYPQPGDAQDQAYHFGVADGLSGGVDSCLANDQVLGMAYRKGWSEGSGLDWSYACRWQELTRDGCF